MSPNVATLAYTVTAKPVITRFAFTCFCGKRSFSPHSWLLCQCRSIPIVMHLHSHRPLLFGSPAGRCVLFLILKFAFGRKAKNKCFTPHIQLSLSVHFCLWHLLHSQAVRVEGSRLYFLCSRTEFIEV